MRLLALWLTILVSPMFSQSSPNTQIADCTFEDGKHLSVEYTIGKGEEPRNGKLWEPGGAPLVIFAQSPLRLLASTIAPAAYTAYIIPGKKEWTLIVNKNVKPGSSYDASQDVARASMEIGEIDEPAKQLQVSFAHIGPTDCSLRLYYGKIGSFVDFKEQ